MLQTAGHSVSLAVDATAGLELLRAATVDVVIIDVDIPENEGLEVLAVVRRDLPTTKVIIVSNGYFPPPAGPLPDTVEVLSKPVGISQLRDTVHRVLGYQ